MEGREAVVVYKKNNSAVWSAIGEIKICFLSVAGYGLRAGYRATARRANSLPARRETLNAAPFLCLNQVICISACPPMVEGTKKSVHRLLFLDGPVGLRPHSNCIHMESRL